ASSDNVGVSGYRVYRGGTQIGTPGTTSFTDTSVSASTTYSYTVAAYDAAGNVSAQSSPASATTPAPPTQPSVRIAQAAGQADPTSASPINFTAVFSAPVSGFSGAGVTISGSAGGAKTVTVSGGPSTYTVAVSGMSTAGTVIASIPAGVARDATGNPNTASTSTDNSVSFDATPPTVPTGLTANAVSSSQINLSWTASSDNVGVSGYRVYRGGTQIGTPGTTSFTDTGLAASTTYSYTVAAYDAAGNVSAQSSPASATTPAPPTQPSVTINQAAGQADPTSASPINFTAVFSAPVSGFSGAGVTISGSAGGAKTVTVSGGPSTYNVAVSGMSTAGTVIASIPAGVAQDAAGNPNTASTSTNNSVSFDATPPTVTIDKAA